MSKKNKHIKLQSYSLSRLFPNMVTIFGLCLGLFAIKNAMMQKWEMAVGLLVIAAVLDNMDGRIARLLNVSSNFGAQLDSLVDFLNFSIAPSLIIYMWKTNEIKGVGWAIALFFIICGALRLARFNARIDTNDPVQKELDSYFFQGIPAPPGALLSMVPMMLTFVAKENPEFLPFEITAPVVICYVAFIGLLLVSSIPTYSFKRFNIPRQIVPLFLAFLGLILVVLFLEPWIVLPIIGVIYLSMLPVGVFYYSKMRTNLGGK